MIKRSVKNPLITPADIKPTRPDFKVECVFNAGAVKYKKETILLLRIAESAKSLDENILRIPHLEEKNGNYELAIKEIEKSDKRYDFSDSRIVTYAGDTYMQYLTSISHFRIARSTDGVNFEISDKPFLFPETKYEAFGCEDPRITEIEGRFYINYSAVSPMGIATGLAVTDDFESVERIGIIFEPDNRDVCLFPEKINGEYYALHRPMQKYIGKPEIWIAKSTNLRHWGDHEHLLGASKDEWDCLKLGGGAQMLKTPKGWLQIYHGVDEKERYCLGALLLDLNNPSKILAKSKTPLLEPEEDYEVNGFFGNVVFSCGAIIEDEILKIYYGAADEVTCLAEITMNDLWKHLDL
jgi:predicted GH43/DUF377 family glycosyl hydrolase